MSLAKRQPAHPRTVAYKAAANHAYLRKHELIPVECIAERTRQQLLWGDYRKAENREAAQFGYAARIAAHRDANDAWLRNSGFGVNLYAR